MVLNFKDFLGEKVRASEAARHACAALSDGDTLALGGAVIDFYPDGASQKYYCISNNDRGEKAIAFHLVGKKDITVNGEGAQLVFHGEVLPFAIDGCENVTVKNLSVDYKSPFFSQARIIEADEEHTVLEFDGREFCAKVNGENMCFYSEEDGWENTVESALCLEFDAIRKIPSPYLREYFFYTGKKKDHGFLGSMYRNVKLRELDRNVIEMCGAHGFTHTVGNYFVCTHSSRKCPGIFVNDSKDVNIGNVQLYHAAAMGIICQMSENITLDKVVAEVRDGSERMLTINADATHFVDCRGEITIKDCKFVNMMDDAANIHGIYLAHPKRIGEHLFVAGFGHPQQVGMNIFRPGDIAEIIKEEDASTLARLTVDKSMLLSEDTLCVFVKETVPEFVEDCVVDNASTAPDVLITRTKSGNNRPRGFLLASSGKTVVENCTFYNMYTGIHIGCGFKHWYESGVTRDITIRNNEFKNSAYAGGCAISIKIPRVKDPEKVGAFHGSIAIENNVFTMHEKRFLEAQNVGNLKFTENSYVQDLSLPSHAQSNERGIYIKYCDTACVEDPES